MLYSPHVEIIAAAYDIAYGFLKGSGRVWSDQITHDILLEKVTRLYERGDRNKIRLANHAIAEYENELAARTVNVFPVRV